MLDLVFTYNPTLVKSTVSIPGLSDHDAIVTDIDIKPVYMYNQQQRRKIYKYILYSQANWEQLKQDCMKTSADTIEKANSGGTIDETWETFKTGIIKSMDKNIPTRLSSLRPSLQWVNRKIKKNAQTKTETLQTRKEE